MSKRTKLTLIIVALALVVIFILQNMVMVEIRFYFWTISMPRSLMMFILVAIGLITGWFLNRYTRK